MGIFGDGSGGDLKQQLRKNKREIDKAIREIDRERTRLQSEEKKHAAELQKAAKEGHKVFSFVLFILISLHSVLFDFGYVYVLLLLLTVFDMFIWIECMYIDCEKHYSVPKEWGEDV